MTGPEHLDPYLIEWALVGNDGTPREVLLQRMGETNRWLIFVDGQLVRGLWEIKHEAYDRYRQVMELWNVASPKGETHPFSFHLGSRDYGDQVYLLSDTFEAGCDTLRPDLHFY